MESSKPRKEKVFYVGHYLIKSTQMLNKEVSGKVMKWLRRLWLTTLVTKVFFC